MHNDIKRQNVLVQKIESKLIAYLTDFGISRLIGIDYQEYLNSYTSQPMGTIFYIAPECLQKNKDRKYPKPTFKSDIWALGALLIELFSEEKLYDDWAEMLECKAVGKMPYSFTKLPVPVQNTFKQCLAVQPEKRPSARNLLAFFQNDKFFEMIVSTTESSSLTKTSAPIVVAQTTSSRVASSKSFFESLASQGTSKEPNKFSPKYKKDLPVSEMLCSVHLSNSHSRPEISTHDSSFFENSKEWKKDAICERTPDALSENKGVSHEKINFTFDWQKGLSVFIVKVYYGRYYWYFLLFE